MFRSTQDKYANANLYTFDGVASLKARLQPASIRRKTVYYIKHKKGFWRVIDKVLIEACLI